MAPLIKHMSQGKRSGNQNNPALPVKPSIKSCHLGLWLMVNPTECLPVSALPRDFRLMRVT